MASFDFLYRALGLIGYHEPLHPPFTHYPIALVTASLFFGFWALIRRRLGFWVTARHCLVLAWLFIFPTVFFGLMDWQRYYQGAWIGPIIAKIYLAGFLFVLLSIGLILAYKGRGDSPVILVIYVLGFMTVVGLGYFGGHMVYEGRAGGRGAAAASLQVKAGHKIYGKYCQACHPNGGNIISPQAQIIGSKTLADFPGFLAWIRDPRLANGKRGAMPDFPPTKISDKEAQELYRYVLDTFGKPGMPQAHQGR